MDLELNQLLGKSRLDLSTQFRFYLFFKLDRKGRILKMWENPGFPHPRDIVQKILKNRNIFKSFDLSPHSDLNQVPETYTLYPFQQEHMVTDVLGDFYTELPFCHISINKINDDLFMGAVRRTNYFPNVSYGHVSFVIYTDEQDRLLGFNNTFYEYFSDRYDEPGKLLGEPCSNFFSPTPLQI